MNIFIDFVFYGMPPLILGLGLFGNLTALLVLFKGKLKKFGPVLIYKLLFIWDTFYIVQILRPFFQTVFNFNFVNLSRLWCKIFYYFNYLGDTISPFLLIYISFENFYRIFSKETRFSEQKNTNHIFHMSFCLLFGI